jgi:hypothetical protein
MNATGTGLARILVIGIVVVEVRDEQATVILCQRMDNRHIAVEREGERRYEHGKSIGCDKDASRPSSYVFG